MCVCLFGERETKTLPSEISKGMAASIFININKTYFDNTFLAGDVVNFWVDIVMFTP